MTHSDDAADRETPPEPAAEELFVDDPLDPSEVTMAPTSPEDPATEWLSADPAALVPLDRAL